MAAIFDLLEDLEIDCYASGYDEQEDLFDTKMERIQNHQMPEELQDAMVWLEEKCAFGATRINHLRKSKSQTPVPNGFKTNVRGHKKGPGKGSGRG